MISPSIANILVVDDDRADQNDGAVVFHVADSGIGILQSTYLSYLSASTVWTRPVRGHSAGAASG